MNDDGRARVARLTKWLKSHRSNLLDEDGEPSSSKMAVVSKKKPTYWSDVLRLSKPSFGEKAAREAEAAFKIPHLHLEGAGWPFEDVDQARFDRLSERQQGRVEQALIDALDRIEAEVSQKPEVADRVGPRESTG